MLVRCIHRVLVCQGVKISIQIGSWIAWEIRNLIMSILVIIIWAQIIWTKIFWHHYSHINSQRMIAFAFSQLHFFIHVREAPLVFWFDALCDCDCSHVCPTRESSWVGGVTRGGQGRESGECSGCCSLPERVMKQTFPSGKDSVFSTLSPVHWTRQSFSVTKLYRGCWQHELARDIPS